MIKPMIDRALGPQLKMLASWYPVLSITGPRQSGKSTLIKAVFPDYFFVNLEEPAIRERALLDPTGFVNQLPDRAIIDEAQYAPELFSALQARVDARNAPGQFVLSGSQNFRLLQSIRQSLAGRVGIAYLLPLAFPEIITANPASDSLDSQNPLPVMARGSYPALHSSDVPTRLFYENYLDTYVTRDVVGLLDVRSERDFRRFLTACASRAGNLVNIADLARDVGVSVPTVRSWLSILESSFVTTTLAPFAGNVGKRLAKTPKLYFYDTGLLCHLLGIGDERALASSAYMGAVFENFVVSEQQKRRYNALERPELMFYRDDSKIEIDLVDLTDARMPLLCEMKSGQTYRHAFSHNLATVASRVPSFQGARRCVVYGGQGTFVDEDVSVYGIREWLTRES